MASLPKRLLVKMRMCDHLLGIREVDGYFSTVQTVFRGRAVIGDEVSLPALALVEAPSPIWPSYAGEDKLASWGNWQLFIQGWWDEDGSNDHPSDKGDLLAADVALRLSMICASNPRTDLGLFPEVYKFDGLIDSIEIGSPVVRAPDLQQVTRAFFYLPLMITMSAAADAPNVDIV